MGQRNRTACKSELIAAIPAAADAPVRKLAGSGQNIAGTAQTPICAKQGSAMTMKGLEQAPASQSRLQRDPAAINAIANIG
jgi:hypothetical protein